MVVNDSDDTTLAMTVLADGRLAFSLERQTIIVWDPNDPTAEVARFTDHQDRLTSLTSLADGRVASGDDYGRVLIWHPDNP